LTTTASKLPGGPTGSMGATVDVAGNIGKVNIAGGLSGDWTANAVKSIAVRGTVDSLNLGLAQAVDPLDARLLSLGSFNAGGWVKNSRILAAGSIGLVNAGGMENTDVYAGYVAADADAVLDLPTMVQIGDAGLFNTAAKVQSVAVKGIKNANRQFVTSFIASNVAGGDLGTIKLCYAELNAAGELFGVAGNGLAKYSYKDAENNYSWSSKMPAGPVAFDNLIVRLPV
jgi:hypothetical protein